MMILVAVLGVAAWLARTADLVARDPNAEMMSHLRQRRDTGEFVVQTHPIVGAFWPRYWRRLLGQPWPGSYVCPDCLEKYERLDGHPLIDLASSDDGTELLEEMNRLDEERVEAEMRALLKRARQNPILRLKRWPLSWPFVFLPAPRMW
jgi:hypothetical protein